MGAGVWRAAQATAKGLKPPKQCSQPGSLNPGAALESDGRVKLIKHSQAPSPRTSHTRLFKAWAKRQAVKVGLSLGIHQLDNHPGHGQLQMRIAKAIRAQCHGKAKALQWLLTHSHAAKLLAVKRVTENKGHRTPGVDGKVWRTARQKLEAVEQLKRRGYQPQPRRRQSQLHPLRG